MQSDEGLLRPGPASPVWMRGPFVFRMVSAVGDSPGLSPSALRVGRGGYI